MPQTPEVTVIVPARNEEHNITRCLASLADQRDVAFEIIVVDDQSSDATASLARQFPNVMVLSAPSPPVGWTGKAHAISQATPASRGKWLLFTDADTFHLPGSLRNAVDEAEREQVVLLSYSPHQDVVTFWEKILQPCVFAELNLQFRYEDVSDPKSDAAAANGQYLLVLRSAYEAVGGHASVKGSLLEDVDLAHRVKTQGKIRFRYAPDAVHARMYTSFAEIRDGWSKNLAALFMNPKWLAIKRTLQALLMLASPFLMIAGLLTRSFTPALVILILGAMAWTIHLRRTATAGYPVTDGVLSVLGLLLFSWLLVRSSWLYRHGRVVWKDRFYRVEDVSGHAVS